ncbi:hypothetical protein AHAS_Ahas10G0188200 [Arachis hypogaea]
MVLQDEQDDRIHATICKPVLDLFRERIKEHVVYSMRNFITKINNGKVRKTAHKNKLNFYTKTEVEVLPIKTFAFNPFKFCTFVELEANAPMDGNLLFVNVQSTYYVSKCYFTPNLLECIDFKKRHVTFKAMLRYRLQVVVTDGSGYIKFLLWNKEAEQMVEKAAKKIKELCKWEKGESYPKYFDNIVDKRFLFKPNITYKNINVVEGVYNALKISDDECVMFNFGSTNSSFDASCSQHVPKSPTNETGDNSNGHETVYLFKDSSVESNGDSSYETLAKRSFPDIGDGTTAEAGVSANVQASANKIFKGNYGQKKLD